MSILQDYERIRRSIGEDKFQAIEKYLSIHTELFLSDIYYKESGWNNFEKWYHDNLLDELYNYTQKQDNSIKLTEEESKRYVQIYDILTNAKVEIPFGVNI